MMTLALLVGIWTTGCIQTQVAPSSQGFVIESYEFSQEGNYSLVREWFTDPSCTDAKGQDVETGNVKLGKKMSGMFVAGETFEADFKTSEGLVDLGAISIKEGHSIKVGRGFKGSTMRNTMVGVFEYLKR